MAVIPLDTDFKGGGGGDSFAHISAHTVTCYDRYKRSSAAP